MINVNWGNVILTIILSGLLGYIFKGVDIAIVLMVIMIIFMGVVILVESIKEK